MIANLLSKNKQEVKLNFVLVQKIKADLGGLE